MPTARGRGDALAPFRLLARLAAVLVAVLLLGPLAGCGVGAQERNEPAPLPEVLPTPPRPPGSGGGEDLVVYLVSGASLSPVRRAVPERRPQDAVDQLLAGPTRAEVLSGLRTALSPQHLSVLTGPDPGGTVTVTVTRGFTGIGRGNQLLATAQVVFTVTELPGVQAVRVTADGSPVEVPTDEGLSAEPVGREDYASVAAPDRSSTPSPSGGEPSGGEPSGSEPSGGEPSGGNPSTAPPAAPSTPGRRRRDVTGP
jgi:hypothetical protein